MRYLLIDAQVLPTVAWHRGMGKYSLEFLTAMHALNSQQKTWDAIEIIVTQDFPPDQEVLDALTARVGTAKVVTLDLKRDSVRNYHDIARHNRSLIDRHIEDIRSGTPAAEIDFITLSPMQGMLTSVFPSDPAVHKALICYDLIPFMFPEIYFRNPLVQYEYLSKLTELLKTDIFFAISKTVANDLSLYLGIDPKRIVSIDGGAIAHSKKAMPFAVPKPFVLMPTGNELRKNNRLGILGFAEFNKKHGDAYTLVITSSFEPFQIAELSRLAPHVVFTGNISGEALNYLYESCAALLFPSEYEGLGLPVLEAVEKGRPVACSDISVFREMSKTAFQYFDPKSTASIARALARSLAAEPDLAAYQAILQRYDWQQTAKTATKSLAGHQHPEPSEKQTLVVFGPNPEGEHSVGRLLQRSYAELSTVFTVQYYLEGEVSLDDRIRAGILPYVTRGTVVANRTPMHVPAGQQALFHISGSPQSAKTIFAALAIPGIVFLHDLNLTDAWEAMVSNGLIDHSRLVAERSLQDAYGGADGTVLVVSVLATAHAVIVTNEAAKRTVENVLSRLQRSTPVYVVALPISSLVYPETTPEKENSAGFLDDIAADALAGAKRKVVRLAKKGQQDREFEDALSRTSVAVAGAADSHYDAIDAMRYGTLPVLLGDSAPVIRVASGLQAALRLLDDRAGLAAKSDAVLNYARAQLSFAQYAQELKKIVQSTKR